MSKDEGLVKTNISERVNINLNVMNIQNKKDKLYLNKT